MIRDFIYFDRSRILSFGSQLLGGLSERVTETTGVDNGNSMGIDSNAKIEAKTGIGKDSSEFLKSILSQFVNFEAKGELELGGNYSHTSNKSVITSEEKLLDHYQFNLLKNAMNEKKLIINLDKVKTHEWDSRSFLQKIEPGSIIEFTSRVTIFDPKHLQSLAISFEAILDFMFQLKLSEMVENPNLESDLKADLINRIASGDIETAYQIMKESTGIYPLLKNALIELMKKIANEEMASIPTQFYMRPKNSNKNGFKFVAPLIESKLTESKNEVIFKYGYEPDQDWTVLAQICKIPKENKNKDNSIENLNNLKSESMDEIINSITEMFMDLSGQLGMRSFVKYPDISVNLIALYR